MPRSIAPTWGAGAGKSKPRRCGLPEGYQGPFRGLRQLEYLAVAPTTNPDDPAAVLVRCFSVARLAEYRAYCGGDLDQALDLYHWNADITGAMWESIGHLEVAIRNAMANRLDDRHRQLERPGSWLDDPGRELDREAREDIAKARDRVRRNNKPASDGQTISELNFGFWRYLLAKRYNTTLWPDLAHAFPHAPNRGRRTVERPVRRLHMFRNRLAHHQRIWTEPLADRWADMTVILGYIDPTLATWVITRSRVPAVLAACPVTRPHP